MAIDPAARQRAQDLAAAAPPPSPELLSKLRGILGGRAPLSDRCPVRAADLAGGGDRAA